MNLSSKPFFRRQQEYRGEIPDVYSYEDVPGDVRVRIKRLLLRHAKVGQGFSSLYQVRLAAKQSFIQVCDDFGVDELISAEDTDYEEEDEEDAPLRLLMSAWETLPLEQAMTILERYLQTLERFGNTAASATVIAAINDRLDEGRVGYSYESGMLLRKDSQYLHADTVKPVLVLLQGVEFAGANEEFRKAHEHYRNHEYKACLVECHKAFESTMKAIIAKRQWSCSPKATASKLVEVLLENDFIPRYLQQEFTGIRITLESGLATIRNNDAGHGQGLIPKSVPKSLASYQMHLTASTILYLTTVDLENPVP